MAGGLHPSNKPLPWHIPTLNSVVRLIVQLSGFLGRKGDGVAKLDKYIIYVPGAAKGAQVKVRIQKISGNVAFSVLDNS